jgi:ubiquinol-cytochrome c reductase cytochrome c subunit
MSALRHRLVPPAVLVLAVGLGGGLFAAFSAGPASGSSGSSGSPSATGLGTTPQGKPPNQPSNTRQSGGITHENITPSSRGALPPAPSASNKIHIVRNGKLVAYGDNSIIYRLPPSSYIPAGQALFAQNCASCHGPRAQGTAIAPNLQGLGPATVDFWVSTGRMPAADPRSVQEPVKPPRLTGKQALEVAAWVNSLDPAPPYIPTVNVKGADIATGQDLYATNCAACHTITGAGDALALNTFAPSLRLHNQPTATQVAEAIRTGPANMPRFSVGVLNDAQAADVVKYVVQEIQHPTNIGGFGLGEIGPVAEGFVALLFGVGGLMLVAFWIGDRTDREEEREDPRIMEHNAPLSAGSSKGGESS